MTRKRKIRRLFIWLVASFLLLLIIGLLIPQAFVMPVKGATKGDYNQESFWYYPWGKSGTHKGVDIFAREGSDIVSATYGMVVFSGQMGRGGNVILVLGPKWRMHYYAHLKEKGASKFKLVKPGTKIGAVGTSGNATGKPAHLHYTIFSMLPRPWKTSKHQPARRMWYVDPTPYLNGG